MKTELTHLTPPQPLAEEMLEMLCDEIDRGTVLSMVEMFVGELVERIDECAQCVAEQDLVAVARHAHSLKGAAGNLGCHQLETLAGQLECVARCAGRDGVPLLFEELVEAATATSAALRNWHAFHLHAEGLVA